ncbi:MAG: phenylphosphate carboxylase subunit gamma [Desulfobacterales bacterium]|nr:MAG: phenylphosphate carboxylase subunit gamma [Desulfobacterales bacterium]
MNKEYDTFVLTDISKIDDGEEKELILRDLTAGKNKYKQILVSAIVSKDVDKYTDILWIRSGMEILFPIPMSINIIRKSDSLVSLKDSGAG